MSHCQRMDTRTDPDICSLGTQDNGDYSILHYFNNSSPATTLLRPQLAFPTYINFCFFPASFLSTLMKTNKTKMSLLSLHRKRTKIARQFYLLEQEQHTKRQSSANVDLLPEQPCLHRWNWLLPCFAFVQNKRSLKSCLICFQEQQRKKCHYFKC